MKLNLVVVALPGALLLAAPSVWAQTATGGPFLPSQMDRSVIRPGARAQGLGGTTLFGSGLSAAAYNPAAITNLRGFGATAEIVGRTNNISVGDAKDIINSVNDLNDAADNGTFPLDAFNHLYSIAQSKNNQDLRVSLTPSVGLSLGNLGVANNRLSAGVLVFGEAIADVLATTNGATGSRTLQAGAGLLGLSTAAVPLAYHPGGPQDIGTFGVNLKYMRADYQAASFSADEAALSVVGNTYDNVSSSKFGLDLGYISPSLIKKQPYNLQAALAVRNAIAPSFSLPLTNNDGSAVGIDASFKQQPQVDAGFQLGSSLYKTTAYAEVHNITGKNGGDATFHLGVEYVPVKTLALRAGVDDSKLTAGIGLNLSGFRVDLGVGQKPQERLALGISFAR